MSYALLALALIGLAACVALEWLHRSGRIAAKPPRAFPLRHLAALLFVGVLLAFWFLLSFETLSRQAATPPLPPVAPAAR